MNPPPIYFYCNGGVKHAMAEPNHIPRAGETVMLKGVKYEIEEIENRVIEGFSGTKFEIYINLKLINIKRQLF